MRGPRSEPSKLYPKCVLVTNPLKMFDQENGTPGPAEPSLPICQLIHTAISAIGSSDWPQSSVSVRSPAESSSYQASKLNSLSNPAMSSSSNPLYWPILSLNGNPSTFRMGHKDADSQSSTLPTKT